MNGNLPEDQLRNATREEIISALFANMVIQRSQTALIFLGRAPNPEGGPPIKDLEAAKHFIDELEMLADKTKGNLDQKEERLLQQSLNTLRMLFVQELEGQVTDGPGFGGGANFQIAPDDHAEEEAPAAAPQQFSAPPAAPQQSAPPPPQTPTPASAPAPAPAAAPQPDSDPESRKRFVKKY